LFLLAQDASPLGPEVTAALVGQAVEGELPQPRVERQWPLDHVAVEPAVGLGQRLLDDVGRIDAGGQPRVEAQRDHLFEAPAVALEQIPPGRAVAFAGAAEQFLRIGLDLGHGSPPPKQIPQPQRKGDAKWCRPARGGVNGLPAGDLLL
jgi:hypothetical protein